MSGKKGSGRDKRGKRRQEERAIERETREHESREFVSGTERVSEKNEARRGEGLQEKAGNGSCNRLTDTLTIASGEERKKM